MNLPLVQGLMGLRLTAFYQRQAGFFKRQYLSNPAEANNLPPNANPLTTGNLSLSTTNDVGRVDTYGAAAALAIKASDNLTITPRVMYQNYQANGFWYADNGAYPVPGPPAGTNVPVDMHANGYLQARFYNLPEECRRLLDTRHGGRQLRCRRFQPHLLHLAFLPQGRRDGGRDRLSVAEPRGAL